ncbi:MAG: immunity 17 family protein [Bacteroides sp.]|nr:immunity 17 family protein [Bacteroides sp.]
MKFHYIIQGLFVLLGLISLLASLWNADWFFTARNTQFVVENVGRNRARLFYGVLGFLLIGMGIFFFCQTIEAYRDLH